MYLFHRIGDRKYGSNFNTREEIIACDGQLSFDGIYASVLEQSDCLRGKDVTFFYMGKYLGGNNSFDYPQPLSRYLTMEEILLLAQKVGARIGYHGHAHRRCVGLTRVELIAELTPPVPTALLAWPHGVCDALAIEVAEELGYTEAFCAGHHGDGSQFQRKRHYLNW